MTVEILKAILVGICAAVPVGPVLVMVIQRTLCHGRNAGIMAGFGSALADSVWAAVCLFTLSVIQDFVTGHEAVIMLAGGLLLALIGLSVFRKKVSLATEGDTYVSLSACTAQTLGSALSNPAALATMLALLAVFGLDASSATAPVWTLVLSVGLGELLYWHLAVLLLARYISMREKTLQMFSKAAGAAVICFALVLFVRGIILLI